MASVASGSFVRQISSLFESGSVAGMSDRQLLDRFTAQRDAAAEAAFSALVKRHGPMVLGVCTELVGDRHHAEDAFQAVFLILAKKARSIRDPDVLGNWLYGVSVRTCRQTKARLALRHKNEEAVSMLNATSGEAVPSVEQAFLARQQAEVLHDEIERLPRAFRLPVVLCYLEGLTVHEAARRLHCSHGTVRSRMARRATKLRRRLTPPRCCPSGRRAGSGSVKSLSRGIGLIPTVPGHHACCGPVRGREVRRQPGDGGRPRGLEIHARDQDETRRSHRAHDRNRRNRRRVLESPARDRARIRENPAK